MQGPFTAKNVGGLQCRHILPQTGTVGTITDRPEGWRMAFENNKVYFYDGTRSKVFTVIQTERDIPFAPYYREELAKRPINIANRQYSTSSARLGNFQRNYEVVMTSGRTKNNLWFHDNSSQVLSQTEVWNLNRGTTSPYLNATLPTRGVVKSVIVNRFSAPGGPEIQSAYRAGLPFQGDVSEILGVPIASLGRKVSGWLDPSGHVFPT